MSYSKLASRYYPSPNLTAPRNHAIDTLTPHCYVAQASLADMNAWFSQTAAQASCNYGINPVGDIGCFVDEENRSWCSGGSYYNDGHTGKVNDHRAITVEVASDRTHPYAVTDKAYQSLINLFIDICKRYNKKKLLWLGSKEKTLAYTPKADEMILTVHRWFAAKECPGDYLYNRMQDIADRVTKALGGSAPSAPNPSQNGTQATEVNKLSSEPEKAKKILEIVRPIAESYKLFPSVAAAQCILESGYCGTELAVKANNICGMKSDLSGNGWDGSTWKGRIYTKQTKEQNADGSEYTITADFRAYDCIEDSIKDRCAYLLGAKNGTKKRYAGIKDCMNALEQVTLIKKGGYATDVKYVAKIMDIISRFDLDQFDKVVAPYTIQVGAFSEKENAVKAIEKLKEKNLNAIHTYTNCFKVVLTNAYKLHSEAEAVVKLLHDLGFDAFIRQ